MSLMQSIKIKLTALAIVSVFATALFIPKTADAHCDRVNGPVAVAAREALATGELDPALIWVGQEQEAELETAFEKSLEIYNRDEAARKVAERYFMSTTVRLHREAEGMPFTGLKPAGPAAEDIQVAEKALESGNLNPVTQMLAREIEKKTSHLYQQAMEAQSDKDKSVEAGREWADAYVRYVVFVHKLYQSIQKGPAHGVGS